MFAASQPVQAADAELNVYNWSEYIAKDTVPNFEKQTGIKVQYDSYDSDDTLQTKLLAGSSGYDIVVPTSNYMAKADSGRRVSEARQVEDPEPDEPRPALMKHDRATAIRATSTACHGHGVRTVSATTSRRSRKRLGENAPVDSWALLFDPAIRVEAEGLRRVVSRRPDDVFSRPRCSTWGKDPKAIIPADYQAAYEVLKKIRPYITQFNSSGYIDDLANNDICVALGWSGDVGIARRRAQEANSRTRSSSRTRRKAACCGST